jgi:hypothetical protein
MYLPTKCSVVLCGYIFDFVYKPRNLDFLTLIFKNQEMSNSGVFQKKTPVLDFLT